MNIESQRMKFESWIKTQRIVIREVSTDGGNTWSRTTVEPSELAMAAWMESARQNEANDEHCETCGKPVDDCECLPCNVCDWTLVADVEAVCEDCRKMAAKDKPNDKSCHTD